MNALIIKYLLSKENADIVYKSANGTIYSIEKVSFDPELNTIILQ